MDAPVFVTLQYVTMTRFAYLSFFRAFLRYLFRVAPRYRPRVPYV